MQRDTAQLAQPPVPRIAPLPTEAFPNIPHDTQKADVLAKGVIFTWPPQSASANTEVLTGDDNTHRERRGEKVGGEEREKERERERGREGERWREMEREERKEGEKGGRVQRGREREREERVERGRGRDREGEKGEKEDRERERRGERESCGLV